MAKSWEEIGVVTGIEAFEHTAPFVGRVLTLEECSAMGIVWQVEWGRGDAAPVICKLCDPLPEPYTIEIED